jgi:hypothetical protein
MVLRAEERLDGFGFDRFGSHADPRLDRRIPRLYGLLLSIAVTAAGAVTLGLAVLIRIAVG